MKAIPTFISTLILCISVTAIFQPAWAVETANDEDAASIPAGAASQVFMLSEDEWLNVGAACNISTTPYARYDLEWVPLPMVTFESDYIYLRGLKGGLKLLNRKYVELSVFAQYDGTSFDSSQTSHPALRKLNNRYSTMDLGAETQVLTPIGLLFANIAFDVLGNNNGMHGALGYAYTFERGKFEFNPAAGLYWYNNKYNDYYYGVSQNRALKSGLKAYTAGAAVAPYVGATVSYDIADDLGVFCAAEVVFLSNAVKDSPMVNKSKTYSTTFGIMYGF